MTFRTLLMMFAVLLVTACSKDDEMAADDLMSGDQMGATMDGTGIDGTGMGDAAPGSQVELIRTAGDRVFFGYDEHNLNDEARATVSKQAEWLQQYPNVNVTVEGHCDERGTREYNLALGERRASAVKNYLIALGVDANRLQTISYGKERPAVPGSDPSAWSQNRRGVLIVE